VELTVDEVEVHGGGRILDRFATLEAELKKGPESALDALAAELVDKEMVVGSRLAEILAETTGQAPAPDVTTIPVAVAGGAVAS
jgi:hypothetical protein